MLRRLTQFSNVRRSSPVSTSGSSLLSAILPAQLTCQPGDRPGPELGHKTTHVVTTELKTGSLGRIDHPHPAQVRGYRENQDIERVPQPVPPRHPAGRRFGRTRRQPRLSRPIPGVPSAVPRRRPARSAG